MQTTFNLAHLDQTLFKKSFPPLHYSFFPKPCLANVSIPGPCKLEASRLAHLRPCRIPNCARWILLLRANLYVPREKASVFRSFLASPFDSLHTIVGARFFNCPTTEEAKSLRSTTLAQGHHRYSRFTTAYSSIFSRYCFCGILLVTLSLVVAWRLPH